MVAEHHPAALNSWGLAKTWNYFYKYRPVIVLYRPYPFLKLMAAGVITPFLPHVFRQTRVSATFPPKANS